jgi:hypothetical protein
MDLRVKRSVGCPLNRRPSSERRICAACSATVPFPGAGDSVAMGCTLIDMLRATRVVSAIRGACMPVHSSRMFVTLRS